MVVHFVIAVFLLALLCQFVCASEFVHFLTFNFSSAPHSQTLLFPLPRDANSALNISLSTDQETGVVISASICSASAQSDPTSFSRFDNGLIILFAASMQYTSTILHREQQLLIAQSCDTITMQNGIHSSSSTYFLLLNVFSFLDRSKGTLAVRTYREKDNDISNEGKIEEKLTVVSGQGEWTVDEGGEDIVIAIGEESREMGHLEALELDMAVRRGAVELSIVGCECVNWPSAWSIPLSNFSVGRYRHVFAINGTITQMGTLVVSVRNGDEGQAELTSIECNVDHEDRALSILSGSSSSTSPRFNANSSSSSLRLRISALSNLTLVALSDSRTFVRPLLRQQKGPSFSFIRLSFWLLLLVILGAAIGIGVLSGQSHFERWYAAHYQTQREGALREPLGFFELNFGGRGRTAATRMAPTNQQMGPHISVQGMAQRSLGNSNNTTSTWM